MIQKSHWPLSKRILGQPAMEIVGVISNSLEPFLKNIDKMLKLWMKC